MFFKKNSFLVFYLFVFSLTLFLSGVEVILTEDYFGSFLFLFSVFLCLFVFFYVDSSLGSVFLCAFIVKFVLFSFFLKLFFLNLLLVI